MPSNMNQPEPKADGSASWVKLDTSVLDNDKLIEVEDLSPAACWLWVKSILFSFRNDTDGRITPAQARRVLFADKGKGPHESVARLSRDCRESLASIADAGPHTLEASLST